MKHIKHHLKRKSSHNFIFFVFLLYVFVATIFTVYVGNNLTSRTAITQSRAERTCIKEYRCSQNQIRSSCNDHYPLCVWDSNYGCRVGEIYQGQEEGWAYRCTIVNQPQGASCSNSGECARGLYCQNGACAPNPDSPPASDCPYEDESLCNNDNPVSNQPPAQQGRCQQDNIGLKCDGGYESGRCPGDAHFRFCRSGWDPNQGVGSQYSGSQQAPGTQNPPAQNPPSGNQGNDAIGRHCSVNNQGGTCQFTSSCNGQSYPASQAPGNGCHIDPRADVQCCIQDQTSQPQPGTQRSACPALPESSNRSVTVEAGQTDFPLNPAYNTQFISHFEVRVDNTKDGWADSCDPSKLIGRDKCDNNVPGPTFRYNFQENNYYHLWYHIVNTCGEASKAQHYGVNVSPQSTAQPPTNTNNTPVNNTPVNNNQPSTNQNNSPTQTGNPNLDIIVSRMPNDIPPVCSGEDLVTPTNAGEETIAPGNYKIRLEGIKDSVLSRYPDAKYGLIIDDLSDGALTSCSSASSRDKCIKNVSPGESGPHTFLSDRSYTITYYAEVDCGRVGNVVSKKFNITANTN